MGILYRIVLIINRCGKSQPTIDHHCLSWVLNCLEVKEVSKQLTYPVYSLSTLHCGHDASSLAFLAIMNANLELQHQINPFFQVAVCLDILILKQG